MSPNLMLRLTPVLFVLSCASVQKVEYPEGTNAKSEMQKLQSDLDQAEQRQVDIIAPKNFARAESHYDKAVNLLNRNAKNESILNEAGQSRAYLIQSLSVYNTVAPEISNVLEARNAALTAGAARFHKQDLAKADRDFENTTERFEKGKLTTNPKEIADLQKKYLDLELQSIKTARLDETRSLMKTAQDMGARTYAPQTWSRAQSKLNNAELVINSDRHDDAAITAAVSQAASEAQKLVDVTRTAREAKKGGSEEVALQMYEQRNVASEARQGEALTQLELQERERQLRAAASKTASFERERRLNETLADAQKKFSPREAEVYRKGNDLVIRMKTLNFASGKSEVPSHAQRALARAKDIIKDLNAEHVVIEGHTDSTGSKNTNRRISEERAESVAQYLADKDTISEDNIEIKGRGDERPIANNKTAMGRAQNRRIDIIITPGTPEPAMSSGVSE